MRVLLSALLSIVALLSAALASSTAADQTLAELSEVVNPPSAAPLPSVEGTAGRTGLSALASDPIRRNGTPPAPPLPFRLAADPSATENATGVDAASTLPPPPPMPHVVTETVSFDHAAANRASHSVSITPAARSHHALSEGPTWRLQTQALLSSVGLGRFEEHRREWLVIGAVVLCLVVIVIGGVRNAVVAGREPVDTPPKTQPVSAGQQDDATCTAGERSPQEITEILERLDTVIGGNEHAAQFAAAGSTEEAVAESATPEGTATIEAAAMTEAAILTEGGAAREAVVATTESAATETSGGAVVTAPQPQRQGTVSDEERERIEQFREISRMMNRADIGRRHRERMREEWLSAGVTSLACVVTGTVCMFTGCFGTNSVPFGWVMFAVAGVLLLRPSLYPQSQMALCDAAASPPGTGERRRGR